MLIAKRKDVWALIGFFVVAILISLYFPLSLLALLLLFYGPPALWLSLKIPRYVTQAALFSFFATVVFFVLDYIATSDGAWWVSTIFPIRLLKILPIENSIWAFLGMYLVIIFYEYFEDGSKKHAFGNERTEWGNKLTWIIVGIFGLAYVFWPQILRLEYAYLWLGILFVLLPTLGVLFLYPRLVPKFFKATIYIFCLHLAIELIVLKTGLAYYPGTHFIGWVELGGLRFPLEEFFFWIGMTAVVGLSYYEFFLDDTK